MDSDQVNALINAARGNEDVAIDKVLRATQTHPRPNTGAAHFSEALYKMKRGEHLTNPEVQWLWDDFNKVVQATTLFPMYEAARFHALGQLQKLESMMWARGIAVPRD
jgi:hypothetical protein